MHTLKPFGSVGLSLSGPEKIALAFIRRALLQAFFAEIVKLSFLTAIKEDPGRSGH